MHRDSISYWFQLSEQDRQEICEETAAQKGLSVAAVEKDWQQDYEIMTQTMIYGNPLPFDELIKRLTELQNQVNTISQR